MTFVAETFVTPSSSNIESVGYDPETETLHVVFRSGDEYDYFNVPPSVYRGFQSAGSAGQYLNRVVKGRYPYEQA